MRHPIDRLLEGLASRTPGLRRIRRPATPDAPAFDLAYARTGPRSDRPFVVVPGGPGLASLLPYRGLRARAARQGLDVIMIEHRGVGLSRRDCVGSALPFSALRVTDVLDDIAAVLDREGVETAYIVGSSYGSYLASAFGARHPDRVRGMVLDSALQASADLEIERRVIRGLFWDSEEPDARAVRQLIDEGADQRDLLDVVRAAYELAGSALVRPLLARRIVGRWDPVWATLQAYAGRGGSIPSVRAIYEFDLVGAIAFRELHYGAPPDGLPFDPALTYGPIADRFPPFAGEPYDLPTATAGFAWPMVLLVGTRDLRTPPAIAERVASTASDAVLVQIDNGHSALESHPSAVLHAMRRLATGTQATLPAEAARIDRLRRRGLAAQLPAVLSAAMRVQRMLGR